MRLHITYLFVFIICNYLLCDEISSGYAKGGAVFLKLPVEAQSAGLGNAGTAWIKDAAGKQFNPALLSEVPHFQGRAMYGVMPMDQKHQSVGLAYRFHKLVAADISYAGYGVDEIERRDDFGHMDGEFDYNDNSVEFTMAGKWHYGLSLGVRGRYLTSKLDNSLSYGFGYDIGLCYSPYPFVALGLSGLNLGSNVKWSTGHEDEVLAETRLGLFITVLDKSLSLSADLVNVQSQPLEAGCGAEYILFKTLAFRTGIRHFDSPDYSFGTGIYFKRFQVDYALTIPWSEIGSTQRFSLTWSYGSKS